MTLRVNRKKGSDEERRNKKRTASYITEIRIQLRINLTCNSELPMTTIITYPNPTTYNYHTLSLLFSKTELR